MNEANETRVFYRAIADFSNLSRRLAEYRRDLAKTKTAEEAFNAQSAKDRAAATKASNTRAAAAKREATAIKAAVTQIKAYTEATGKQTTATRASTKAEQAQSRSLGTNENRLKRAAKAASDYAVAQKKISSSTGPSNKQFQNLQKEVTALQDSTRSSDAKTRALKKQAVAFKEVQSESTKYVSGVGRVNQVTGEVEETAERAAKSTNEWATALGKTRKSLRDFFTNTAAASQAQNALNRARLRQLEDTERVRIAEARLASAISNSGRESSQAIVAQIRLDRARRASEQSTSAFTDAVARMKRESNGFNRALSQVDDGLRRTHRGFLRLGNWRPRLTPPFIALVPIIGAVVAAINPLVAILGSLGPLALGLASNIGSLSGAFLALPGILSAVVGGISSVIASMGGVGNVFKTYSAMQKSLGRSGSGGPTQAERAQALADAEWNLAKAQRNVTKAQENLNKAREEALRDLIDLRMEVSRASLTEERAIADLRLAQEEYWNVMADPGSTLGDKLDAAAAIKEAEADLQDVRQRNIDNQKALNEAEAKGVENADRVVDAQERYTDALMAQRDAQRSLATEQSGGASALQAVNDYNKALAELSPSARTFVLAILAMEDQWKSFRRSIQEEFFSKFIGDLDRLPRILSSVERFLRPSADSMGRFTSSFLQLVDSPEWTNDLASIGEQNGRVLDEMGRGGLSLAGALKDVVIAAGPFTEWLVGSLATGVENFEALVGTARDTGSLATWLDKAAERMSKWWQVIKNIGSTLFNYSAAASEFGDWILDNLVDMTAGWSDSAKAAREAGSPFQKWLVDVKPLLSEVNGLLGDFFSWFREEAMDIDNIQGAIGLLSTIRTELGPALARILDTISETNIDEQFIHALARILEFVDSLLQAGGNAILQTFFDVVTNFFDTVAGFFRMLPAGSLETLGTLLGTIAAMSFIGKFTGITNMIGGLLNLAPQGGKLGGIFGSLKGMNALQFTGLLAAVSALINLPSIMGSIRDGWNGLFGIDLSSISKAAQYVKDSTDLLGRASSGKYTANEFNQSRNWVFDAGRQFIGSDAAWQKVDDQLRAILDTGDLEAFQSAWDEVVNVVGSDAEKVWSLVYKDAQNAGAQIDSTSSQIRNLGTKSDEARNKISRLRDELGLIGGNAMSQSAAFDTLASSIESLGDLPPITFDELNSQTENARTLRDRFREVETNARNAAQAVLDNGGSIEEAKAKYDEGRQAIVDYITELTGDPNAARDWADGQLGPAEEVRAKFEEIKDQLADLGRVQALEFQLKYRLIGVGTGLPLPTTNVNGKEVIDFAAMGRMGNEDSRTRSGGGSFSTNGAGTGFSGGGGGGLSVGLTQPIKIPEIGLADKVKQETNSAQSTWSLFWANFNKPMPGPLGTLQRSTQAAFSWVQTNVFRPFELAGQNIQTAFQRVVDGLRLTWDSIRTAFSNPVNFVIQNVYNNGIRAFWNKISDTLRLGLGLPEIGPVGGIGAGAGARGGYATGGVLPGYTPGRDVHTFKSRTGGTLELSGGEAIMRPEWTRMVGGKKAVDQMNSDARKHKFASGGIFGGGALAGAAGKAKSTASRKNTRRDDTESNTPVAWIMQMIANPMKYVTDGLNGIVSPLLSQIGGGQFGQMLGAMPGRIISSLGSFAQQATPKGNSAAARGLVGGKTLDRVLSVLPANLRITSTYRTPAQDLAVGGTGRTRHTRRDDPAVDIAGPVGAMNAFARTLADMGGWYQVLYNNIRYPGVTWWPGHSDHVHAAMKDGGVLPNLYDRGGWLKHGQMGVNLSGKPEAVLTNDESRGLKALLSGGGLGARPAVLGANVGSSVSVAAPQNRVVDNSVNIGEYKVVNPVPEKASVSLPKSIRKVAYVNQARE